MHNHVILTGRFAQTPELKQTQAGVFVCTVNLAVRQRYNKSKTEQETDFIEIEAWRNTAEFISRYFTKGDMVDITGRLKTSRWKDNNDVMHYKTSVLVESVDFAPTNNRKASANNAETDIAEQGFSTDFAEFEEITVADKPL